MTIRDGPLVAFVREAWIDATNKRLSGDWQEWTDRPTIHAIVIQSVKVEESQRRQGHFKRFVTEVCADPRFEMVVVEAVQNQILAEALLRWGWDCDPGVMDFYWRRTV